MSESHYVVTKLKPLGRVGLPRGGVGIRRLCEFHARDEGVGDGDFFGEGERRGLDGEILEAVAGAVLEDEVA